MNMCANHAEKAAVAYCRSCGKPLCEVCRIEEYGAIYCAEHTPAAQAASGFAAPPPPPPLPQTAYANPASPYVPSPYAAKPAGPLPGLAFFLGMIPGVGAIYNGQYAKGLIHAVVFGLLITIANNDAGPAPLIGILIGAWWFYMLLEAFHTARKKRLGEHVDEFSSIVQLRGSHAGMPLGAIVLIGVGILLLLNTTGLVPIERIVRYWPAGLILLGVYMLYAREHRTTATSLHPAVQELTDERQ